MYALRLWRMVKIIQRASRRDGILIDSCMFEADFRWVVSAVLHPSDSERSTVFAVTVGAIWHCGYNWKRRSRGIDYGD